jgi:3-deoxy-D-manno-octulosonic-acid transferase
MLLIYNLVFPLIFLCYLPFYALHLRRRGGLTADYWQRFGFFSKKRAKALQALDQAVWIHAVSVGETVAALTFIARWRERRPHEAMVFSCGTATAFATAAKKLPPGVELIYCPMDFFWAVRRALSLIRPRLLVIFEVEIWPNLILMAKKRGSQVVLVNGRMSDKSSRGYARWRQIFQPIFDAFAAICVQTDSDAERVARVIGQDSRIHVCDTMKFDQVPDVHNRDLQPLFDECFGSGERLIFTAGSTHSGEEELVCRAYKELRAEFPQLRLVLVPRHHERSGEVEEMLRSEGLSWRLLKPANAQSNTSKEAPVDLLLVNTTGELMNFYGASDIAYVGKSLAGQHGGHNIIEPAIFGKAILHGVNMENFRAVAALFQEHHAAIAVARDEDFTPTLRRLLAQPAEREALGAAARQLVDRYRGAIDRSLDRIDAVCPPLPQPRQGKCPQR